VVNGGGVQWQAVGVGGANVIDRRSMDILTTSWSVFYSFLFKVVDYAPPITGGHTQPLHPHAPNHYSDTLQGSKETTILLHNPKHLAIHVTAML